MELFRRIEDAHARWNVLKHPFYTRWEKGELTREELQMYAGQYRHAVTAVATAARTAASPGDSHAAEEAAHVMLWDAWAASLGADKAAAAPETQDASTRGARTTRSPRPPCSMPSSRPSRRSPRPSWPASSSTTATGPTRLRSRTSRCTRSSTRSTPPAPGDPRASAPPPPTRTVSSTAAEGALQRELGAARRRRAPERPAGALAIPACVRRGTLLAPDALSSVAPVFEAMSAPCVLASERAHAPLPTSGLPPEPPSRRSRPRA